MKRSFVNKVIKNAEVFLEECRFRLPPWAYWSPEQWQSADTLLYREITDNRLGWDVTNMGSDDFYRRGLILFTIRNGGLAPRNKPYAEKIMIIQENQETALHYHSEKTEDIINRCGGKLVLELFNSKGPHELEDTVVQAIIDGVLKTFSAGEKVILSPGESICLTPGVFHRFYALEGSGPVLAGEVSSVNDDETDNYFYERLPRYSDLLEDEEPYRVLCNEYGSFFCKTSEDNS